MTKLFPTIVLVAISLMGFSQLQTLPFTEDFSGMQLPNQWSQNGTWNYNNQDELFTTADNGYSFGIINWGFSGETKELLTPFIDVSTVLSTVRLRMEQNFRQDFESFCNILITNDGGLSWDTIQKVEAMPINIVNEDLSTFISGADSIQIRFSFGFTGMPAGGSSSLLRWAFDDISIQEDVATDMAVISINTPNSGCADTDTVNITVKNMGTDVIYGPFTVSYFNGTNWIDEQITQNVTPNHTVDFTFATAIILDETANSISAKVSITGDMVPSNNEMTKTLTIIPSVTTFPYNQDFENDNGSWFADNTENGTFEWGEPNSAHLIGGANASANAWVTNLTGNYGTNEKSYLYSPCFDFSLINNPVIEMDLWYQLDGSLYGIYSGMTIEYSLDNGQTWIALGNNYDGGLNWYDYPQGWYGINNEWKHAMHSMDDLANESKVNLRFAFSGYNLPTQEGAAIDNIFIHEAFASDLSVSSINSPINACGLSQETINITISNLGSTDVSSFDIDYTIDGTNWVTETISQTITAGNDADIDLSQTVDLSAANIYTLQVRVTLTGDENTINDELSKIIVSQPILTGTEIFEDFETPATSQFWVKDQEWNSSTNDWELSTPSTTNINNAHSGTNAWVTNATGNFALNQTAYIVSPCMDLTSIPNPAIEFYLNNHVGTQANFNVEYSIDGGANWTQFNAEPSTNQYWFNSPYTSFTWDTQAYEAKRKTLVNVSPIMNNLSSVKFRFSFTSGNTYTAEGSAFDDFKIYQDDTLATLTSVNQVVINKPQFNIFPNPAINSLQLTVDNEQLGSTLQILDITGKTVKQFVITDSISRINIADLQNGIYFIKVGTQIEKFIKE